MAERTQDIETPADESPRVYATLDALADAESERLEADGVRAYEVSRDHERVYVAAHSPGQAALSVVTVTRQTSRELQAAALRALSARKTAAK